MFAYKIIDGEIAAFVKPYCNNIQYTVWALSFLRQLLAVSLIGAIFL